MLALAALGCDAGGTYPSSSEAGAVEVVALDAAGPDVTPAEDVADEDEAPDTTRAQQDASGDGAPDAPHDCASNYCHARGLTAGRHCTGLDIVECGVSAEGCGVVVARTMCRDVFPHASAVCEGTPECRLVRCEAGWGDCNGVAADGCEFDARRDRANCGGCGVACRPDEACIAGVCERLACGPPRTACSGMCLDLRGDLANCGVCGRACATRAHARATCALGLCGFACDAGYADCDRDAATGCETDTRTSTAHCGACRHGCAAGTACRDGACDDALLGLALGAVHTCALRASGSVVCVGGNYNGQVGSGTDEIALRSPEPVADLLDAVRVRAGYYHTCAVRRGGAVACWGRNSQGQLGDGTSTHRRMPVAVGGLAGARDVAAGEGHTCALLEGGGVACWGENGAGQLGDGTTRGHATPAPVPALTGVAALTAGQQHACALRAEGTVACWGRNDRGQLGDGTTVDRTTPTAVVGLADATDVACGWRHCCALRRAGTVACWGSNESGALARAGDASPTPVAVPLIDDATAVAAGADFACARRRSGEVWCWGSAGQGQVGDGVVRALAVMPVRVAGLADAVDIAAGASHACARLATGRVTGWGRGGEGQLTRAAGSASYVPVILEGLP